MNIDKFVLANSLPTHTMSVRQSKAQKQAAHLRATIPGIESVHFHLRQLFLCIYAPLQTEATLITISQAPFSPKRLSCSLYFSSAPSYLLVHNLAHSETQHQREAPLQQFLMPSTPYEINGLFLCAGLLIQVGCLSKR